MIEQGSHVPIEPPSTRGFGVLVGTAFLCIGLHPIPFGRGAWTWSLVVGLLLLVLGLTAPDLLRVPNKLWFRFGLVLGSLVANFLMVVVFTIVITPTGVLMRRFRRDYLGLKVDPSKHTYWTPRNPDSITPESLQNQY